MISILNHSKVIWDKKMFIKCLYFVLLRWCNRAFITFVFGIRSLQTDLSDSWKPLSALTEGACNKIIEVLKNRWNLITENIFTLPSLAFFQLICLWGPPSITLDWFIISSWNLYPLIKQAFWYEKKFDEIITFMMTSSWIYNNFSPFWKMYLF